MSLNTRQPTKPRLGVITQLKGLSRHSYCLAGNISIKGALVSFLEKELDDVGHRTNADFFDREYETFAIDNAREIKLLAGTKPVNSSGKRIFILTMNGITIEAQNAMLKLLEEPADYARFFLIMPSSHLLLPTVRSRLHIIELEKFAGGVEAKKARELAVSFLAVSVGKRLEAVKNMVDDIAKEKKSARAAIDFLNSLEEVVREEKGAKSGYKTLEAIELTRKYASDRAPSMKMLLEYVALSI